MLEKALNEQEVQQYVRYFVEGSKYGRSYNYVKMIHGCKSKLLENVTYKLWSFGIGQGINDIDNCFNDYVDIMEYDFYRNIRRSSYGVFQIAELLSLIGFSKESIIYSKLQQRLNQLYNFCKQDRYDIYIKSDEFRSKLPSSWKHIDKIIDPALTTYGDADGEPPLPSVYDVLGLVGMKKVNISKEDEKNRQGACILFR